MSKRDYATNIGLIVLTLARHEVGDWGDCSINNPITSIVDKQRPAHELLQALANMDRAAARGIVRQICPNLKVGWYQGEKEKTAIHDRIAMLNGDKPIEDWDVPF